MKPAPNSGKRHVGDTVISAEGNFEGDDEFRYMERWAEEMVTCDEEELQLKKVFQWTIGELKNISHAIKMIKLADPVLYNRLFKQDRLPKKAKPRLRLVK